MVRRLFRKLFQAKAHHPKPHVPAEPVRPEYLRFILKQLSYQSRYFPELTGIHNKMLKVVQFHKKTIPIITGNLKLDVKLTRNMRTMLRFEEKINTQRSRALKPLTLEETKAVADEARMFENQFNLLKEENFLIFKQHFGPTKNANGSRKKRNGQ